MTTDAVGSLSFCSCAAAVVTATDLVVSAAVVETAAAAPSSGSYLFFAAADAVSKALHHKTLPLSDKPLQSLMLCMQVRADQVV